MLICSVREAGDLSYDKVTSINYGLKWFSLTSSHISFSQLWFCFGFALPSDDLNSCCWLLAVADMFLTQRGNGTRSNILPHTWPAAFCQGLWMTIKFQTAPFPLWRALSVTCYFASCFPIVHFNRTLIPFLYLLCFSLGTRTPYVSERAHINRQSALFIALRFAP